jgi:ribosome maturation factor RimP
VVPYFIDKKMITDIQVTTLLEQHLEGSGIFIVEVEVGSGNAIRVHLDKMDGISIDECVGVSRFINGELDRDLEDYSLEVSSPGATAPFRVKQQYEKNMGRMIEVYLNSGDRKEGKLEQVSDEGILIKVKGRVQHLLFSDIKKAKAIISFN